MKKLLLLAILSVAANSFAIIKRDKMTESQLRDHINQQNELKERRANGVKTHVHKTKDGEYHIGYNGVVPAAK